MSRIPNQSLVEPTYKEPVGVVVLSFSKQFLGPGDGCWLVSARTQRKSLPLLPLGDRHVSQQPQQGQVMSETCDSSGADTQCLQWRSGKELFRGVPWDCVQNSSPHGPFGVPGTEGP